MGYDMHIVDADPTKKNPDVPDVDTGEGIEDGGYFRLNIWGMGICRAYMDTVGVIDWDVKHGDFVSEENYENTDETDEYGDPVKVPQFYIDQRAMKSKRSPVDGKVPGFKFCSNDGWVVTPEECLLIAAAIEKFLEDPKPVTHESWGEKTTYDKPPEWLKDWVSYCRRAAEYGGFDVW